MERRLINVILISLGIFMMSSCLSVDLKPYRDAMSDICVEWGADQQRVTDYMADFELKYDGGFIIDYFLKDKDQIVTYRFYNNKLRYSSLIIRTDTDASFDKVFNGWDYLGSRLADGASVMITSMVDFYVKENKNLLATTYSMEHNGVSYRIIGFAPITE